MKKTMIMLFLLFTVQCLLFGQQTKEISHYLFPEFASGTVLMKDGRRNPALLNFNAATEEMVFNQNGQVLALAEPTLTQTDTVIIGSRRFVLHNHHFVEWRCCTVTVTSCLPSTSAG